jgi:hypothetical protein
MLHPDCGVPTLSCKADTQGVVEPATYPTPSCWGVTPVNLFRVEIRTAFPPILLIAAGTARCHGYAEVVQRLPL